MNRVLFILALWLVSCTSAPTAPSDPLSTTVLSCRGVDAAIKVTDAAVKANTLKGKDADNAIAGLVAAQAGCNAALNALQPKTPIPAAPASGASQ